VSIASDVRWTRVYRQASRGFQAKACSAFLEQRDA
jgi:hypothetical protein